MDLTNFDQLLRFISGPGAATVLALVLYQFVPDMIGTPWDENIPPKWRRPVLFLICLAIPVVAALCRVWAGYAAFNVDALLYPALSAGWAYFLSTMATGVRKLPGVQPWRQAVGKTRELAGRGVGADSGRRPKLPVDMRWDG